MSKKLFITALLSIVTVVAFAQNSNKVTITGYVPDVKDSTIVLCAIDTYVEANDTIINGRFTLTLSVEKLTTAFISLYGKDCPSLYTNIYISPGLEVKISGKGNIVPLWTIESSQPEQITCNKLKELTKSSRQVYYEADAKVKSQTEFNQIKPLWYAHTKKIMEVLPSMPIDLASITELQNICNTLQYDKEYPYKEELKQLLKATEARISKEHKEEIEELSIELAEMNRKVYPPKMLKVGEKGADTDFYDINGKIHHLSEIKGKYILLDFWSLGCGPCRMAEPEMRYIYSKLKDKLEIVGVNEDRVTTWKNSDFSKKIVWKNWNDGKGRTGIESQYNDLGGIPCYVLLSPDRKILWKFIGYGPGLFLGFMDAMNSIKQDNSKNLSLVVKKVETSKKATTVHFRVYGSDENKFQIVKESYLKANGKKYQLKSANNITLDTWITPEIKATDSKEEILSTVTYKDFSLTFEPFDKIPATFTYQEGDNEYAFVIKDIATK